MTKILKNLTRTKSDKGRTTPIVHLRKRGAGRTDTDKGIYLVRLSAPDRKFKI